MDSSCRTIQYLSTDGFDIVRESADCNAHTTARKLLEDIEASVVLIETGESPYPRNRHEAHVGTGFFVNNGDEVVTNAHVAIIDAYVNVFTKDGKQYPAKVVKLDDDNDLAVLKLVGAKEDPERALKPAPHSLKKEDELFAFGHPDGSSEIVISPGSFLNRKSLSEQVGDPKSFPDLARIIKMGEDSNDPLLKKEVENYLASERLHARMNIHHANSGSPLVDSEGKLQGIVANRLSAAHSLMIPSEKLQKLLDSKAEFDFEYEEDANKNLRLKAIKRTNGSSAPPVVLDAPE